MCRVHRPAPIGGQSRPVASIARAQGGGRDGMAACKGTGNPAPGALRDALACSIHPVVCELACRGARGADSGPLLDSRLRRRLSRPTGAPAGALHTFQAPHFLLTRSHYIITTPAGPQRRCTVRGVGPSAAVSRGRAVSAAQCVGLPCRAPTAPPRPVAGPASASTSGAPPLSPLSTPKPCPCVLKHRHGVRQYTHAVWRQPGVSLLQKGEPFAHLLQCLPARTAPAWPAPPLACRGRPAPRPVAARAQRGPASPLCLQAAPARL